MKLELKHVASYLPYELKVVEVNKGKIVSDEFIIDACSFSVGMVGPSTQLDSFELERSFNLTCIKPILRPLSDLTKEIDGVVHLDIIKEIYPNVPNFYSLLRTKTLDLFALCDTIVEYCVVQYLFQHHFDVYGLINNNLAIDANKV